MHRHCWGLSYLGEVERQIRSANLAWHRTLRKLIVYRRFDTRSWSFRLNRPRRPRHSNPRRLWQKGDGKVIGKDVEVVGRF